MNENNTNLPYLWKKNYEHGARAVGFSWWHLNMTLWFQWRKT